MAKNYTEELRAQIAALENQDKIKEAEIQLLLSEKQDTLRPSIAMDEMAVIIVSMLMDNNAFVKKNGLTPKAKESKERLMRMLELNSQFDKISMTNYSLQCNNRTFHADNMKLRLQIAELKKEINTFHQTTKEL